MEVTRARMVTPVRLSRPDDRYGMIDIEVINGKEKAKNLKPSKTEDAIPADSFWRDSPYRDCLLCRQSSHLMAYGLTALLVLGKRFGQIFRKRTDKFVYVEPTCLIEPESIEPSNALLGGDCPHGTRTKRFT